jgi:DNA-binding NarL/FixJ family response regulator
LQSCRIGTAPSCQRVTAFSEQRAVVWADNREACALPHASSTRREETAAITDQKITVAIVEDHVMVAEALMAALGQESDLEVVGSAASVADGIDLVADTNPDVVLVDFELPDGDGTDATEAIREQCPSAKVVMLTGWGDSDTVARAIEAGVSGFLVKSQSIGRVVDAVRRVHDGEALFSHGMLRQAVERMGQPRPGDNYGLTDRELEVLQLLASGLSTDDIGERLVLSIHTVRNHIRNLLAKLGAHSRVEAVAIATRDGLLGRDRSSIR